MNENRTWINRVCDSGVDIIDIGLDLTRTSRSDFYTMEILEILIKICFGNRGLV